jgi:hypothetical protein
MISLSARISLSPPLHLPKLTEIQQRVCPKDLAKSVKKSWLSLARGHAAVIVRRWQELTGKSGLLEATAETFAEVASKRSE